MKKVIIYGAGGHAKVVADCITCSGDEVIGFIENQTDKEDFLGVRVFDSFKQASITHPNAEYIIAVGNNEVREKISKLIIGPWYTAIHPSALISRDATIGCGCMIMAGVIVNANTTVGNHTIINTGVIVEHDNVIGNYVHLSPHCTLCGSVTIGNKTWLGANTTVINNLKIGEGIVTGAASCVINDLCEDGIYVGVPCKKIK